MTRVATGIIRTIDFYPRTGVLLLAVKRLESLQGKKKMKALVIRPENQTIEPVDVNDRDDLAALIGYDTVIADEIGPDGDQLFFDEECFLRGTTGRFQIDQVVPVAGVGVIVGSDGQGGLVDASSTPESIRARLKYL